MRYGLFGFGDHMALRLARLDSRSVTRVAQRGVKPFFIYALYSMLPSWVSLLALYGTLTPSDHGSTVALYPE